MEGMEGEGNREVQGKADKNNLPQDSIPHRESNGGKKSSGKPSKPYREIYRPPSLRSKNHRTGNCSVNKQDNFSSRNNHVSDKSNDNSSHDMPPNGSGSGNIGNHSPHLGRRPFPYGNPGTTPNFQLPIRNLPLNTNAKEFHQYAMTQQQMIQAQQLANLIQLGQLDPKLLASAASLGLYSLQQSKSLGNNLNLMIQQQLAAQNHNNIHPSFQQPPVTLQHLPNQQNFMGGKDGYEELGGNGRFNRLAQSRSSGSIPDSIVGNRPRVRFDLDGDDDMDDGFDEATMNMIKNVENLRISGGPMNGGIQRSKTGFNVNSNLSRNHSRPDVPEIVQGTTIKRSRSFGCRPAQNNYSTQTHPLPTPSLFSDIQISIWPRNVQEVVTTAITAVERVTARQQIELVNLIFDVMLQPEENGNNLTLNRENGHDAFPNNGDEHEGDLTVSAVHIFLYFIQREKDRLVLESLLNVCCATFQKLFGTNCRTLPVDLTQITGSAKTFLRFLSHLYSQVKQLRRKKEGRKSIDEMSFSVLSILCDSCLAILRSNLSSDPESMGCLFTVMTSQGRDIELSFPVKMKQLLSAVRDALLRLGPYSKGLDLCPAVQKTLMQLIELHANSWVLPASAVRYYYSNQEHKSPK